MNAPRSAAMSDQRAHRNFPHCAIDGPNFFWNLGNILDGTIGHFQAVPHAFVPHSKLLEFDDEIAIHLEKIAGQRLPFEQIRNLGFDALKKRLRSKQSLLWAQWRSAASCAIQPRGFGFAVPPIVPRLPVERPRGSICSTPARCPCFPERGMRAELFGKRARSIQCVVIDFFLNAPGQLPRFGRVEREVQSEEDILQPHDAQTYGPPLAIRIAGRGNRIEIDVDNAVKKFHRPCGRFLPASRNQTGLPKGACPELIEPRLQTAVSWRELTSVISVQRLERCTTFAGFAVWFDFQIAGILERHPTVSGFRENLHHSRIEFARFDLPAK